MFCIHHADANTGYGPREDRADPGAGTVAQRRSWRCPYQERRPSRVSRAVRTGTTSRRYLSPDVSPRPTVRRVKVPEWGGLPFDRGHACTAGT